MSANDLCLWFRHSMTVGASEGFVTWKKFPLGVRRAFTIRAMSRACVPPTIYGGSKLFFAFSSSIICAICSALFVVDSMLDLCVDCVRS